MLAEFLTAVQQSSFATGLRASHWVYPAVNAGHILGIALLFGGIVPLDLRLLGLWRSVPAAALARVLVPVAVAGMALAIVTGLLLFTVDAVKYAGARLFQVKMLLVFGGIANAVLLGRIVPQTAPGDAVDVPAMPQLRAAAVLSIAIWFAVVVCGRMLGYVL